MALLSYPNHNHTRKELKVLEWLKAMQLELNALLANGAWDLVEFPANKIVIGCKCMFKVKLKIDQTLDKYNACLFAKGFL